MMQYPSLLWENALSAEGREKEPTDREAAESSSVKEGIVPENSLADLVLPLDFSKATRELLRRLCSAAEIRFRGEMIRTIADAESLDGALDTLYTETEAFERLLRRYDKANPETTVLLFPAVAAAYLRLLELWQRTACRDIPAAGGIG